MALGKHPAAWFGGNAGTAALVDPSCTVAERCYWACRLVEGTVGSAGQQRATLPATRHWTRRPRRWSRRVRGRSSKPVEWISGCHEGVEVCSAYLNEVLAFGFGDEWL